ncbi:hypothetical protein CVT25_006565 [Psilocybe cyanescens]|uniref:Uncharacterized protein n=1 Tax=Psilocybe cyanescens TaxID=93625 RepID=A0A409X443_PSICY|nr:hypothetical protein CVT25_006565 [Psilocybe cyanescens]
MQFNVLVIASALLASASVAVSTTITGFAGADCTGTQGQSIDIPSNQCFLLGNSSTKSVRYSGVPNQIVFFIPNASGSHSFCTGGASLVLGPGSGCATAPAGANWDSIAVF